MLTTTAQVIELGNLPKDTHDDKLNQHLYEAESRMREFLGDSDYETYDAETDADPQSDRQKLARAEGYLALSLAVPVLNLRSNGEGGFVSSVGFAESKNTLLSREDIKEISQDFHDKAWRIISQYVEVTTESTEFGNGFGVIAVGSPDA